MSGQQRLREALCAALRQHLEGRAAPQVPEAGRLLWSAFADLCHGRSAGGLGPNPIGFGEIESWSRLMRLPLEPHHVRILMAMDAVWLDAGRSSAPAGVKPLPPRSASGLTPGLFDVMMG